MKKLVLSLILLISIPALAWGPTGHRTIGHIAEQYLTKKAKKALKRVLGNETLAIVTNWMDEVRSDDNYDYAEDWHWVTIPDGETYESSEKNPDGDVIDAIERLTNELKKGGLDRKTESEHVKMIAHLVGDIHMPLHVGNGTDLGGNKKRVKWMWRNSNLHIVWDSGMIDYKKFSYTELAASINFTTKEQVIVWQKATVRDWAKESMALRDQCYEDIPEDGSIGYEYAFKNWPTVEKRILQAGVRLAGVYNQIYQ